MRKLIFLFFLCSVVHSCENDIKAVQRFITEEESIREEAKNVEILYSDSAIVRIKISAPTLWVYNDKRNLRKEFPHTLRVDFLDNYKRTTSWLTAKHAVQYEYKREIIVKDSVILSGLSGDKLETEQLVWNERKENISSTKFVKVSTPTEVIYGYGFESNQDFTKWKIHSVTGRIRVDDFMKEIEN